MSRSKVREFKLPLTGVFAGSALAGLLFCGLLAGLRVDLGLNLSLVGLLLAILLPLGIEVRNRSGRPRKVLVLDYRSHHYGHAVARGALATFNADKRAWVVTTHAPTSSSASGSLQWQIRELQAATIDEVDGLILIPAGDDERLWFALAAAIKSGMFVVTVDTKPPNHVFRDVGIDPPRFVSSRYSETGVLIGRFLKEWMMADAEREVVLWIGPEGSWPGEERSRNVVYEIAALRLLERCTLYPIDSWTPESTRCRDTLKIVRDSPGPVAVYCADDENALALHLYTLTEEPALRSRMHIIGCNATPDDWGNVPVVDMHAVDTTVDILAQEQGVEAAMLLVKERNSKLNASERSVFIPPKLVSRGSSTDRWLDSLFTNSDVNGTSVQSNGETSVARPTVGGA